MTDPICHQRKGLTKRNKHVKYESYITYHSKLMANVKFLFLQTNRQVNKQAVRQTDRSQTLCHPPPIYRYGGIKIAICLPIVKLLQNLPINPRM